MAQVIVDAGPLVAYFDRKSGVHEWVRSQFQLLDNPLFSCEAALTEVVFLLRRDGLNPEWILDMVERGEVICHFDLRQEISSVRRLMRQYADQEISLADACLVHMSELQKDSVVFTLDRDFLIYRRSGRQKIPLLAPFA